jgi:hypothetical protein
VQSKVKLMLAATKGLLNQSSLAVRYQEWYVQPIGMWCELRVQYLSAWWERPMGAALDMCCHRHVGKCHCGSEMGPVPDQG